MSITNLATTGPVPRFDQIGRGLATNLAAHVRIDPGDRPVKDYLDHSCMKGHLVWESSNHVGPRWPQVDENHFCSINKGIEFNFLIKAETDVCHQCASIFRDIHDQERVFGCCGHGGWIAFIVEDNTSILCFWGETDDRLNY